MFVSFAGKGIDKAGTASETGAAFTRVHRLGVHWFYSGAAGDHWESIYNYVERITSLYGLQHFSKN